MEKIKWQNILYAVIITGHCIYAALLHLNVPLNSDFANQLLEGADIVSGNPSLSGWNLTGITFFTTELPFYALGSALFGVNPYCGIFVIALMYICLFLTGFLAASGGKHLRPDTFLLYLILAGMPTPVWLGQLRGHCGAFIYVFLSLYALDRFFSEKKDYRYLSFFMLLSALACAGDLLYAMILLIPLGLVCLISLLQNRGQWDRGHCWSALGAIGISLAVGLGLEKWYLLSGGLNKNNFLSQRNFTEISALSAKFSLMLDGLLKAFRADFSAQPILSIHTLSWFLYAILFLIFAGLVCRTLWRFLHQQPTDLISLLLSLSTLLLLLLLFLSDLYADESCARYLAWLAVGAAVLLARQYQHSELPAKPVAQGHFPASQLVTALALLTLLSGIQPIPRGRLVTDQDRLAAVLRENDLKSGYSSFWNASSTTVAARNQVKVRPIKIIAEVEGQPSAVAVHNWAVRTDWYYPTSANFIIFDGGGYFEQYAWYIDDVFGPPQKQVQNGRFRILIYDYDISSKVIIPMDAVNRPESAPVG